MSYTERKTLKEKQKRLNIFNKCNNKCAYCGCDLDFSDFHIDHIEPRKRFKHKYIWEDGKYERGSNEEYNLFPSCPTCNMSKADLYLDGFRERILDRLVRLNMYSTEYKIAKKYGIVAEIEKPIIFYFETL